MVQIIEQTEEEKVAMYMKSSKKELVAMLMTNQKLVNEFIVNKEACSVDIPTFWINND